MAAHSTSTSGNSEPDDKELRPTLLRARDLLGDWVHFLDSDYPWDSTRFRPLPHLHEANDIDYSI
ncbi:hypothetical protein VTH06DRAFT_6647 [Thermothelomyces fergusii]